VEFIRSSAHELDWGGHNRRTGKLRAL
jgi:hypothetical protein